MNNYQRSLSSLLEDIRGYLSGFTVVALVAALALPLFTGYSDSKETGLQAVHFLELIFNFDSIRYVPGTDPDVNIFFRLVAALALLLPVALLLTPPHVTHRPHELRASGMATTALFVQFLSLALCWIYTWTLTWGDMDQLKIVSWGPGMFCLTIAHLLVLARIDALGRMHYWLSAP